MEVQATNGHASFIVPIPTTDEQNAGIVWNGFPAAADDWTADIIGHNDAGWSDDEHSEFKFLVLDQASDGDIVGEFALRMASGAVDSEYLYPKCFLTVYDPNGISTMRHIVAATNSTFGLRLVHTGGLAGDIAAWYDPTGTGTAWTLLDVISVSDFSPGMTSSDTFALEIMADDYYGPILEGDIWADDFLMTNSALGYQPHPVILGSGYGLGVQSNSFGFTISWATNISVIVQATTNLANPVWTSLATNPLVSGTNYFSDPNWTNYPRRFYRVVSQ